MRGDEFGEWENLIAGIANNTKMPWYRTDFLQVQRLYSHNPPYSAWDGPHPAPYLYHISLFGEPGDPW